MKKRIKRVLFKLQVSKLAHFLVPLLWAPVHAFIFNRAFNTSYAGGTSGSPYKFYDLTPETEAFVQDFRTYINTSSLLVRAKEEMRASPSLSSHVRDIFPELPVSLRAAAYRMALNDIDLRAHVAGYFGFTPRLHDISILYNIPVGGSSEEGSKLWHRDAGDCDFKNMKVFMPLVDISKENGPFFFLESKKYAKHYNVLTPDQNSENPWLAERVSNQAISPHGQVRSNIDAKGGQRLLIDTVNTYHKGGFCASEDRLMLQISYHGSGHNATAPMDFSEMIAHLMNNTLNLNEKEINREIAMRKDYFKQSRLELFLKWVVFKLGNIFICRY